MNITLKKLELKACRKYIYNQTKDVGCFSNLISRKTLLDNGEFYSFAPPNAKEGLYEFDTGGLVFGYKSTNRVNRIEQVKNYAEKIVLDFIYEFLRSEEDRCLLMEDYYAKPNDPWVVKKQLRYRVAGQKMVYMVNQNSNKEKSKTIIE